MHRTNAKQARCEMAWIKFNERLLRHIHVFLKALLAFPSHVAASVYRLGAERTRSAVKEQLELGARYLRTGCAGVRGETAGATLAGVEGMLKVKTVNFDNNRGTCEGIQKKKKTGPPTSVWYTLLLVLFFSCFLLTRDLHRGGKSALSPKGYDWLLLRNIKTHFCVRT